MVEDILRVSLDIAKQMLMCGGEIRRIENTVERICRAYGVAYVEVIAIPNAVIASAEMDNGSYSLQMRRVEKSSNDLCRLEELNALSRKICNCTPSLDTVEAMLETALRVRSYNVITVLAAAAVAAASFVIVFGGGIMDAIISSVIGVFVFFIDKYSDLGLKRIAKSGFSAFVSGILACISFKLFTGLNVGAVVVGVLVLLVPGLAFGNGLGNLLGDDLLSGILGIVRAFLTAVALALGYAFAFGIFGVEYSHTVQSEGLVLRTLMTLVGVTAFAVVFDVTPRHIIFISLGGLVTFLLYRLSIMAGMSYFVSALVASVFSGVYSEALARIRKAPVTVFQVPCSIPVLPGISLYNAMNALVRGDILLSLKYFSDSVLVGTGIACAVTFVAVAVSLACGISKRFKILYK